jgi:L-histidine N-alpha-methyltransferase
MNKDRFERSEQIKEYFDSLRLGFLPLKFAYIGSAAYTHDELVRSREYGMADKEAALIRTKLASIVPSGLQNMTVNVIDIGGGNGLKATHVIKTLIASGSTPYYFSLDYSSDLAMIAAHNITAVASALQPTTYIIDFELAPFPNIIAEIEQQGIRSNLFLLLGHTLGNPAHRDRALMNISQSMSRGSYLLVGVELYQSSRVSEILDHYRNEPFYRAVFNPLTFGGIGWDDGNLEVSFNEQTRDVEVHFDFTRECLVEDVSFHEGDRLLIFISHRFETNELIGLFTQAGLQIHRMIFDDEQSYVLVLSCKSRTVFP